MDMLAEDVVGWVGGITEARLVAADVCTAAVIIGCTVGCCIVAGLKDCNELVIIGRTVDCCIVGGVSVGIKFILFCAICVGAEAGVFVRMDIKVDAVLPIEDCVLVAINGLIAGMLLVDNGTVVTFN